MRGCSAPRHLDLFPALGGVRPEFPGVLGEAISPFMATMGFQPLLFNYQKEEAAVPSVKLSRVKLVVESSLSPPDEDPMSPPVQIMDGAPAYSIRKMLDTHWRGRGFQYLVDWGGFGPEERSWVTRWHILDRSLLRTFHQHHPNKLDRAPGGAC